MTYLANGIKALTVAQLRSLLDELPDTCQLACNRVDNLTIIDDDLCVGYIDFGCGVLELAGHTSRWESQLRIRPDKAPAAEHDETSP